MPQCGRRAVQDYLSMIIDAHTHLFCPEIITDPCKYGDIIGEQHWKALMCPETGQSLQSWVSPEKMLEDMQAAGVDHAILLAWYWQQEASCEQHNRFYAQCLKDFPGHFSAFLGIVPKNKDHVKRQLEFALEHGFIGIGEMHPGVQKFSLKDDLWVEVIEFAVENNLAVNLHVTEPLGRNYTPRADTDFREIQWLIEHFPDLKLVLSHWGGLVLFHELNPYIRKCFKNVYYDTAASPLLYDNAIFNHAFTVISDDKLIYGSDYSLNLYPSQNSDADFKSFLDNIDNLELTESQKAKLLSENAKKRFGIGLT